MPKKLIAKVNGTDTEVEVDDAVILPQEAGDYVKKDFMQSEITRRLAQARKGLVSPDEVLADEEFKSKALKEWGVSDKKKLDDADVQKIRGNLEETMVKPLQQKLEEASQRLGALHKKDLQLQIIQAARDAGVQEHWLAAPAEGMVPPIVNMLEPYFGQSGEHGDGWFLKDGDTFAYAKNPTSQRPFKTAAEFIPEFVSSPKNAPIFVGDKRQKVGPNNGSRPSNAGSSTGTLSSNDPVTFGQNLEAIAKGTMRAPVANNLG